jgi:uncharacterized membrane protein YdcZ (DUF606 family)
MKERFFSMDIFVAVALLALLIEKLAEVVKTAISPAKLPAWGWFAITSGLGMLLCVLFNVNIFTELGFVAETSAAVVVGQLISGIAAGSGSGFIHDLIHRLKLGKSS